MEAQLTYDEIEKAFEICSKSGVVNGKCKTCPYFLKKIDCVRNNRTEKDCLRLVRHLENENEELKRRNSVLEESINKTPLLTIENERLKEENSKLRVEIVSLLNGASEFLNKNSKREEAQTPVAPPSVPIGKFKDQAALKKAYESLEKEFTRRSQKLRELQKHIENTVAFTPEELFERDEKKADFLKGEMLKLKDQNASLQKQISELQNREKELTEELEKAYEIERANIQAEIADAGIPCHWCRNLIVEETVTSVYQMLKKYFGNSSVVCLQDIQKKFKEQFNVEV